mmetsp:Transcript_3612/g.5338  ORF Transcript_3612/g.5338 Transcript_3612/m.5338 type:complete len:379 (+) Transcript_3612:1990-3126(+)|eukprot:CAMPEP_0175114360 /NCGR_PEP_ID=MMETSP0086_2-20121207/16813_1 /TAXON_ID=136419 /ORGANISM="Unknown Unknown, Strain D1" /LENGTH=378 /DNA_ID=CAMNT_0016394001 /DNA_START=32 /DNA_END=1168 /DNA_ORIENTATION=-
MIVDEDSDSSEKRTQDMSSKLKFSEVLIQELEALCPVFGADDVFFTRTSSTKKSYSVSNNGRLPSQQKELRSCSADKSVVLDKKTPRKQTKGKRQGKSEKPCSDQEKQTLERQNLLRTDKQRKSGVSARSDIYQATCEIRNPDSSATSNWKRFLNEVCCSSVQTQVQMRLPFFLKTGYWQRHKLTRKDISSILAFSPSQFVWLAAAGFGFPVTSIALKHNPTTWENASVSTKCNINSKFLDLLATKHSDIFQPGDCKIAEIRPNEGQFRMPPPVYSLTEKKFAEVTQNLVDFRSHYGTVEAGYTLEFLESHWVPLRIERSGVYCERLERVEADDSDSGVNRQFFDKFGRYKPTRTLLCPSSGRRWRITEEGILITALI